MIYLRRCGMTTNLFTLETEDPWLINNTWFYQLVYIISKRLLIYTCTDYNSLEGQLYLYYFFVKNISKACDLPLNWIRLGACGRVVDIKSRGSLLINNPHLLPFYETRTLCDPPTPGGTRPRGTICHEFMRLVRVGPGGSLINIATCHSCLHLFEFMPHTK